MFRRGTACTVKTNKSKFASPDYLLYLGEYCTWQLGGAVRLNMGQPLLHHLPDVLQSTKHPGCEKRVFKDTHWLELAPTPFPRSQPTCAKSLHTCTQRAERLRGRPRPLLTSTDPAPNPATSGIKQNSLWFRDFFSGSASGSGPVGSVCFGPSGSESGFISQRYGSEGSDPLPDVVPICHGSATLPKA